MTKSQPPVIYVRWCPVCERTDRFTDLKDRHFANAQRCKGTPMVVRYEPVRQRALR